MRKLLLLTLMSGVFVVGAQDRKIQKRYPDGFRKAESPAVVKNRKATINTHSQSLDNGIPVNNLLSRNSAAPTRPVSTSTVVIEEPIGYSYYDNQTNGSISNRIVKNADGTISAGWTFSPNANSGFPQRGTGYNYYDGTQWVWTPAGPGGDFPNTRIEPTNRTGFINIVVTASGKEMSIGHSSTVGGSGGWMLQTDRPVKGTGAWTEQTTALGNAINNDTWSKAIADGETVYSIWQGVGTATTTLYGQDGPILFSRSDDGGATWPVLRQTIPEIADSTEFAGWGSDCYSIDARNGTVAIAIGEPYTGMFLLKSTDGGANWTRSTIVVWPHGLWTADSMYTYFNIDGTLDTNLWGGSDPSVLIDNSGMCHVWFSQYRWQRDSTVTTAGSYSYFPYSSDGLFYWNENMPADGYVEIAAAQDYNGNDTIDFASPIDTTCDLAGTYNGGLTQMPSSGIDANGVLYCSYQSLYEGCDTNDYHQVRKHVYIITSTDGGQTWTYPYDVVPSGAQGGDGEHQEAVFCSMAKTVDNNVYLVYQRDPAPGEALSTNACTAANNSGASDIIATFVESSTVGINKPVSQGQLTVSQNYPNPAFDFTMINIQLVKSSDIKIEVSDMLGKRVYSETQKNAMSGLHTVTLNTANYHSGIYFYSVYAGGTKVTKKMIVE